MYFKSMKIKHAIELLIRKEELTFNDEYDTLKSILLVSEFVVGSFCKKRFMTFSKILRKCVQIMNRVIDTYVHEHFVTKTKQEVEHHLRTHLEKTYEQNNNFTCFRYISCVCMMRNL